MGYISHYTRDHSQAPRNQAHCPLHCCVRWFTWLYCLSPRGTSHSTREASGPTFPEVCKHHRSAVCQENRRHVHHQHNSWIVSRRPTQRIHWQQHSRFWYGGGRQTRTQDSGRKVPEHGMILGHSVTPRMTIRSLHKVGLHTQTKGPINLIQNIVLFILQSYSNSDLDLRGEGCIQCCTEYVMILACSIPYRHVRKTNIS